jgi:hypothetical protein
MTLGEKATLIISAYVKHGSTQAIVSIANTSLHVVIMATEAGKFLHVLEQRCSRPVRPIFQYHRSPMHSRHETTSHPRADPNETRSFPFHYVLAELSSPAVLRDVCIMRVMHCAHCTAWSPAAFDVAWTNALATGPSRLCLLTPLTSSGFPGYIPPDAKLVL